MRINAKHIILRSTRKKPDSLKERVTVGCSRRRPQFAATMSTKPNLKPNPNLTLWTWLGPLWTWLRLQPTLSAKSQASYNSPPYLSTAATVCLTRMFTTVKYTFINQLINRVNQHLKYISEIIITSCARDDTICPRPSPPPWVPKRLARRRAYFPTPNTFTC